MGEPAARPRHLRVAVMNNRLHAREFIRFGSIDPDNLCMRHVAAQDTRVEHTRKLKIAGVLRLPGHALVGIDARSLLADDGKFFLCLCHNDLP